MTPANFPWDRRRARPTVRPGSSAECTVTAGNTTALSWATDATQGADTGVRSPESAPPTRHRVSEGWEPTTGKLPTPLRPRRAWWDARSVHPPSTKQPTAPTHIAASRPGNTTWPADLKELSDCWRNLSGWRDEILNLLRHRQTNGSAEGVTNKIKVMKRRSYGFTNRDRYRRRVQLTCHRPKRDDPTPPPIGDPTNRRRRVSGSRYTYGLVTEIVQWPFASTFKK